VWHIPYITGVFLMHGCSLAFTIGVCLACVRALAQPDPSGIDFVTIGAPGNPAYNGPDPTGRVTGRGSVGYEFKLSRTEVSTAQWLEFYNTFKAREDAVSEFVMPMPLNWGAEVDPTYSGPGRRYRLRDEPGAGDRGVYGVSWRTSARFCNWLHNDKSVTLSAIANGAYDASTFTYPSPGQFTDQITRNPDARYWIPSLDEWLKAAHYDPANPDRDGWWLYSNRSDNPLNYGPPGEGDANAGFALPGFAHYLIPLGSYPNVQSPWGLLDMAGAAREWTEHIRVVNDTMIRTLEGSAVSDSPESARNGDRVNVFGGGSEPGAPGGNGGLRIAAIPASGTAGVLWVAVFMWTSRRNRRPSHEDSDTRRHSGGSVRGGGRYLRKDGHLRNHALRARRCASRKFSRTIRSTTSTAKVTASRSR
jgi:formylglycine-generating enzyme required for sulfatase activity